MSEQNKDYWAEKLSIWLHDPVMKALSIQGHEEIAKAIAERLFQSVAKKDEYASADVIAAGLTRASLPAHNPDETKNGAIDFLASPVITHPLVKGNIQFKIPEKIDNNIIAKEIEALLVKDLGLDKSYEELRETDAHKRPLNGWYDRNATPEEWNKALYFYLFFAFQKRLRNKNVGRLGALWDMLPADTRMPDHSIWSHLGLTSAIGSAMKASNNKHTIQLGVFSITPVQDFISKSRKLRDYWTSSVILSYLAFTGIKTVMNKLGPDHVVYPSLHNQSLVEAWIKKEFNLQNFLEETDDDFKSLQDKSKSIAAFPNKFVFIVSPNQTKTICEKIKNTIQNEWIKIAGFVKDYLARYADDVKTFEKLFETQINDYWNYSWSACNFVSLNDIETVKNLLPENKYTTEKETVNDFKFNPMYDTSKLYGTTHSLVQGLLAAGKTKPTRIKQAQLGEKCPLCGEHEVLHGFKYTGETSAKEYDDAIKSFWKKVRNENNPDDGNYSQVGEKEHLCAVCSVKRFLPMAIKWNEHKKTAIELSEALKISDGFPSTTEMSAFEFLETIPKSDRDTIIQKLHEHEFDTGDDETDKILKDAKKYETKYYAFLLMDGDKMGDLINGETLSATWGDVIHPNLKEKFNDKSFAPNSKLRSRLNDKRTLNPAVHETISDSLNNFARFAVQPIIENHKGKLIYAGGDDVCAILPLSTALHAATEISKAYTYSFVRYTKDGAVEITTEASNDDGKIGMHLGSGAEGISISGAIVIAHHKEPLKEVISEAHHVLDRIAKEKSGRNSLAIRLKKRSGGNRDVYFKWNDGCVDAFKELVSSASTKELSASLLYKIESLRGSIEPLADDIASNKDLITKLIHYEVAHSEQKANAKEIAEILFKLCVKRNKLSDTDKEWFMSEVPIVANFLAKDSKTKEINAKSEVQDD